MEIFNDNTIIMLNEEYEQMPFAGNINDSFNLIQMILEDKNQSCKKQQIIENSSYIINLLAGIGNVQEMLVFDTALLFILAKYSNISLNNAKDYFGKFSIESAEALLKTYDNINDYLKSIFENEVYPYIGKIKLADTIYELKKFKSKANMKNSNVYKEAKNIVDTYSNYTHKKLIDELKLIIE